MRNVNSDLYRILMTWGIVLIHVLGVGKYTNSSLSHLYGWTLCGFMFISGFYGVKCLPSKFIRLLGTALFVTFCLVTISIFYTPFLLENTNYWSNISICMRGYWYVWSYCILLILSPIFNSFFKNASSAEIIQSLIPILFFAFIWNYLVEIPILQNIVPHFRGAGSMSFVALVCVYYIAMILKKFPIWKTGVLFNLSIFFMCSVFAAVFKHGRSMTSPLIIATVISSFILIQKIKIPPRLTHIIDYLTPSMFSVYLYHATVPGFNFIGYLKVTLIDNYGVNIYITYCVVTIIVFLLCICLDIPRRICAYYLKNIMDYKLKIIDNSYNKILQKIEHSIYRT